MVTCTAVHYLLLEISLPTTLICRRCLSLSTRQFVWHWNFQASLHRNNVHRLQSDSLSEYHYLVIQISPVASKLEPDLIPKAKRLFKSSDFVFCPLVKISELWIKPRFRFTGWYWRTDDSSSSFHPVSWKILKQFSKMQRGQDWPASWSSGQSFWLLITRSQVRFPVLPWEFSL